MAFKLFARILFLLSRIQQKSPTPMKNHQPGALPLPPSHALLGRSSGLPAFTAAFPSRWTAAVAHMAVKVPPSNSGKGQVYSGGSAPASHRFPYFPGPGPKSLPMAGSLLEKEADCQEDWTWQRFWGVL
jgi:hypothetical protein